LVGILYNKYKTSAKKTAAIFINKLKMSGVRYTKLNEHTSKEVMVEIKIICVFGGDGTLLYAARHFAQYEVPMIAINLGQVGFLAAAEPAQLDSLLADLILKRKFSLERRMMLTGKIERNGGEALLLPAALNDICLVKGPLGRMTKCKVIVDQEQLGEYAGDGVIIATPTGSTAYSLSCNGPLIAPELDLFLLTPISSQVLALRPIVLPSEVLIMLQIGNASHNLFLVVDGQVEYPVYPGDKIVIFRSKYRTLLAKPNEGHFFKTVKKKLYNIKEVQARNIIKPSKVT
jgi:NAD+ kinase